MLPGLPVLLGPWGLGRATKGLASSPRLRPAHGSHRQLQTTGASDHRPLRAMGCPSFRAA